MSGFGGMKMFLPQKGGMAEKVLEPLHKGPFTLAAARRKLRPTSPFIVCVLEGSGGAKSATEHRGARGGRMPPCLPPTSLRSGTQK